MGTSKFAASESRSARTLTMRATAVAPRQAVVTEQHVGWDRKNGSSSRSAAPSPEKSSGTSSFSLPRGQRLPLNGAPSDPVTVVQSGWIALFKALPGNRSICIGLLGPGDLFFHERSCVADEITAESLVDSVMLREDFQRLVGVLSGSPPLVQAALVSLRRQATDMQDLISRVLSRDITLRIAAVLLNLSNRFGKANQDGTTAIGIPVAHKMLARMIGSNRVTVTRVMTEMRDAGMVWAPGRNRIVVDRGKLRSYLSGDTEST